MDRLIPYISQFDHRFATTIQGAKEEQIDQLEALYARPLPHVYRRFLATMGVHQGGLRIFADAACDIDTVYDRTSDMVNDDSYEAILSRCVVIGEQLSPGVDLCLEDQDADGRCLPDPRVVAADVEVLYPVAQTLLHLLMRQAFATYAMGALTCRGAWAGRPAGGARQAHEIAIDLGFRSLWFSDEQGWCGERDGARMRVSSFLGEPVGCFVASDKPEDLVSVGAVLERELGLSTRKVVGIQGQVSSSS